MTPYRPDPLEPEPAVWRPFILGVLALGVGNAFMLDAVLPEPVEQLVRLVAFFIAMRGALYMRDYGYASCAHKAWEEKRRACGLDEPRSDSVDDSSSCR